ncbi:hypothetical protein RAS1_31400 [Phycisphaerae bacterium RAS1]|nr:hypothetical protein RAS1_31400 [Phycisphaerae bacterium RAS1]
MQPSGARRVRERRDSICLRPASRAVTNARWRIATWVRCEHRSPNKTRRGSGGRAGPALPCGVLKEVLNEVRGTGILRGDFAKGRRGHVYCMNRRDRHPVIAWSSAGAAFCSSFQPFVEKCGRLPRCAARVRANYRPRAAGPHSRGSRHAVPACSTPPVPRNRTGRTATNRVIPVRLRFGLPLGGTGVSPVPTASGTGKMPIPPEEFSGSGSSAAIRSALLDHMDVFLLAHFLEHFRPDAHAHLAQVRLAQKRHERA